MILVTLGTQDKKFYRLIKEVDRLIEQGKIKEEVIVQAGSSSNYKTDRMKVLDLLPMDEFQKALDDCDLLITHGGVGTILKGLNKNKKIIAVPRLKKFKEHVNDHQIQIVNNFSDEGYILKVENINTLYDVIEYSKVFKPKKYKSNNKKFIENLSKEIDKCLWEVKK